MSDYPKMLYLGSSRTPYVAESAAHEAELIAAMAPKPDATPRQKKAK